MPNKAFQSILETLAAQIEILNKNGYKLYDLENREFYISSIIYESEEDKLVARFKEDTENVQVSYNSTVNVLVDSIAAQLNVLNSNDYKIYDEEYKECFITGIEYNSEAKRIFIKLDEEMLYRLDTVI